MSEEKHSVLWRRVDRPGHEAASVARVSGGWELAGAAVFLDGGRSVRLDYRLGCADDWSTRVAVVTGWIGSHAVFTRVEHADGVWRLNGAARDSVEGCVDLDLNFSPATNLLPIRRLRLAIGDRAAVRSAWLRYPSLELEPLEQTYTRLDQARYRYESATGFTAELRVDGNGFVIDYPGLWAAETTDARGHDE